MSEGAADRNDLCAVLSTVPERAADAESELDAPGLAYRHGPSFPTVAEILSHLCQSGIAVDAALRPAVLGEAPEVRLREALETDRESDLLPSLAVQLEDFSRVRRRTVDLLHGIPSGVWEREVLDPTSGRLTLREAVGAVVRHELGHLSQVQSLVALLPVA